MGLVTEPAKDDGGAIPTRRPVEDEGMQMTGFVKRGDGGASLLTLIDVDVILCDCPAGLVVFGEGLAVDPGDVAFAAALGAEVCLKPPVHDMEPKTIEGRVVMINQLTRTDEGQLIGKGSRGRRCKGQ